MSSLDVPSTMLAAQLLKFNDPYAIHKIPTPKIENDHYMLVRIAVASLCHTDAKLPVIPSHEGAGRVVKVGGKVTNFKPGDRVLIGIAKGRCGSCADCTGGYKHRQYCTRVEGHCGILCDGSFAEYQICDSRECALLPDKVSTLTAAPLACAGRTVYRGVLEAQLAAGEWIAMVGSGGGLGHLGIQMAKAMGLKVVGIDARDEGLALSRESGADIVVDAREGKDAVVKQVQDATDGFGASATLCLSDHPIAASLACGVTKMHGRMVQIAQPDEIVIPFREVVFRDVRVVGSLLGCVEEIPDMLELVVKHNIKVRSNVFYGLDSLPRLLELAHSGKLSGKAVLVVDNEAIEQEKKDGILPQ